MINYTDTKRDGEYRKQSQDGRQDVQFINIACNDIQQKLFISARCTFSRLTLHVALNREEQERVEGELNKGNKFSSTTQGQTRSLILIEYFTVGVINHPYECRLWLEVKTFFLAFFFCCNAVPVPVLIYFLLRNL